MNRRLPRLTARRVRQVLERQGFAVIRQSGSHNILRDPSGRRITLPVHAGQILPSEDPCQDHGRRRAYRGRPPNSPGILGSTCPVRENMTIIMVMDRTLPLAQVKAHLSEVIDGVESEHDRVIITRNGRATAVILSPADLEAIEETLDLLSRPGVPKTYARPVGSSTAATSFGRRSEIRVSSKLHSTGRFELRVAPSAARSLSGCPNPWRLRSIDS